MADLEPVVVIKSTGGRTTPGSVQYSVCAMAGIGGGDHIGEVRGPFSRLSDILDEYPDRGTYTGHNALYRAANDFFANGGRELYLSECQVSSEVTQTEDGDASTKEFTIPGITLEVGVGTLTVEHPVATFLTEGTDYVVDYSNGKVCFKTAPAVGVANIQFKYKETTAAFLESALDLLASYPINLVCAAFCFHPTLAGEVKDHIDAAKSAGRARLGFVSGQWGDATTILTTASTVASEHIAIQANRAGFYNKDATDPSLSWFEFKDPSACLSGIASANKPWESLHFKPVQNLNWYGNFSTTDETALVAAFINLFRDPAYYAGTSKVCHQAYTLDPTAEFRWIDDIRLYDYIDNLMKATLSVPEVIGHLTIDGPDMEFLYNKMKFILVGLYREGAIANPDDLPFTSEDGREAVYMELVDIFRKDITERNAYEKAFVQSAQITREVVAYVNYDSKGAVHKITVYLGKV